MTAEQIDLFPDLVTNGPPCASQRFLLQREEGRMVLRCLDCETEIKKEGV